MSIRNFVVEDLAKSFLKETGHTVSFSFGDPVVRTEKGRRADPQRWHDAMSRAEAAYALVLLRIDFNRLVLQMVGAYTSLGGDLENVYDLSGDPERAGKALRMVLETKDTWPDWDQKETADV